MLDPAKAGLAADDIVSAEVARQDAMWGRVNERADISKGQLLEAGIAQVLALHDRRAGNPEAFKFAPEPFPTDWSGFRDYGSDVANLAVAAAFIRQEMKRLIAAGADTTRKSRDPVVQPFTKDQPAVQL